MTGLTVFKRLALLMVFLAGIALPVCAEVVDGQQLYAQITASGEVPELSADQDAAVYKAFLNDSKASDRFTVDNLWICIAAGLVFIMHLGFATLETGLTQSKNTVNILFKNTWIVCIGLLTYYLWGFNMMYPGADYSGGFFGFSGFLIPDSPELAGVSLATPFGYGLNMTTWTDFLFQGMFAATAATIVSGAVAERVKLSGFMIFSVLFVGLCYPITGFWKWGGGFLQTSGFYDFAGSTLVHSVGGWGALAFILLLGPRTGKYLPGGRVRPIIGHSMPLAMIGVMLLWLGWFGFNGGSVLSADPVLVSFVLVTTSIAAAAGGVSAIVTSWVILKKPDLSMGLNGILAGLVGITAGADVIPVSMALLVGVIAGALVVVSVIFFDKIKIDDPVGALSVHLVCGVWGTLAVGLFSINPEHTFLIQLKGVACVGIFTFVAAFALTALCKYTVGIRVTPEEEAEGLDLGEHGQEAYADFQSVNSR